MTSLQAASQHDAEMKRPVPLQVLSSGHRGSYRLYAGAAIMWNSQGH